MAAVKCPGAARHGYAGRGQQPHHDRDDRSANKGKAVTVRELRYANEESDEDAEYTVRVSGA